MKMIKHYSLEHAEKVLKLVGKKLKTIKGNPKEITEITVECWSNGREQGFHLVGPSLFEKSVQCVNFAQQRKSDQIVVYYGNVLDFDISTHQPETDMVWKTQYEYFNDDTVAANFIVKKLLEG
jgi:hypothetical protein